ncbi:MAG: hypothetical protein AAGJ18_23720, partial [Bacteroidota bacterium]
MKNALFILLLLLPSFLMSQASIYLHFDKNFYVLGETIRYNAYLSAERTEAKNDAVLRVALIDASGTVRQENQLLVDNNVVSGTLSLPLDWEEGWYTFRAYTVWNPIPTIKNSTTVKIPIYNDFQIPTKSVAATQNTKDDFAGGTNCIVTTSKNEYKRRSIIAIDLALEN